MPDVTSVRVVFPDPLVNAVRVQFPDPLIKAVRVVLVPASGGPIPIDVAFLSAFNVFTNVNKFTGIQFSIRDVSSDDNVTPLDFGFLADATANPFTLFLPPATGTGQPFLFVKNDDTLNSCTILAQAGENIDGSISTNLIGLYSDCLLVDMGAGYWHNFGPRNALLIPDDPPSVPALDPDAASLNDVALKVNDLITLLDNYGLSQ